MKELRKKWQVRIVYWFILFVGSSYSVPTRSQNTKQNETWTVYIQDGKSEPLHIDTVSAEFPLEKYAEHLRAITSWNIDYETLDVQQGFLPQNLTVTEIGQWYTYTVIDVTNKTIRHKSILLKDSTGNYRILYTQFRFSTASVDEFPSIVQTQGQNILVYRTPLGGVGGMYYEYFFAYHKPSRMPAVLDLKPIYKHINTILPEGKTGGGGAPWGGLDIHSLTYRSYVWTKDDFWRCPTGGAIYVQLDIKEAQLIIVDTIYDPDEDLSCN